MIKNIIYLFINTKSGNTFGSDILKFNTQAQILIIKEKQIQINFVELNNPTQLINGLQKLKNDQFRQIDIRIIACGGDGSIIWIVDQMQKANINLQQLSIGIYPLGTGNDFSRIFGWGATESNIIDKNLKKLKLMAQSWINAQIIDFDIWEAEVFVHQNGYFKTIKNKKQKFINQNKFKPSYKRCFSNYCSFGVDARIGYIWQTKRTQNRFINTILGFLITLKNNFLPSKDMIQLIQKMQIGTNEQELSLKLNLENNHQNQNHKIIFDNSVNSKQNIKSGFKNLLALNINSYLAGGKNMWKTNRNATKNKEKFVKQSSNDGLIQFLCWKNQISLIIQKVLANTGSRISQNSGPVTIKFKKSQDEDFHTHLQIDGQFFKIGHPDKIIIRKSNLCNSGKIKVLKRREGKQEK